jgi:zinc metalloprotease ZmpB
MKNFFNPCLLWLLFIISTVSAQKKEEIRSAANHFIDQRVSKASFATHYIGSTNSTDISTYLLDHHLVGVNPSQSDLHLIHANSSIGGAHFTFIQQYSGISVYGATVKVNMDKKGNIRSLFDNSYVAANLETAFPNTMQVEAFVRAFPSIKHQEVEKVYFPLSENQLTGAYRIQLTWGAWESKEFIMDAMGMVIYAHDLNRYYHASATGKDTVVPAKVFNPDPLTRAKVPYGSPYVDMNDTDVPELNAMRIDTVIKVDFANDTFRLKNAYVEILDFDMPADTPAFSVTVPNFIFTRSQKSFEHVNTYFHLNVMHQHLVALGFNLMNNLLWVDAHGYNGSDNSKFIGGITPKRLIFGDGGVDDAEDADVIIHEYGHAISNDANGNQLNGTQRQTLDEANSDYLAASYSRNISSYGWKEVYSWDGHNEFWTGRDVYTNKKYPTDMQSSIYKDADIWSATIMEIWEQLGRDVTDRILLQSLYGYADGMDMVHAAHLFEQADSLLYNGSHSYVIRNAFCNRGFYSGAICPPALIHNVNLLNAENVFIGSYPYILFKVPQSFTVSMYNMHGQLIRSEKGFGNYYEVDGSNLSHGVYIIRVVTDIDAVNFKVIHE